MVKVGGFSGGGGTEITNATLVELLAKEGYEIDENMIASLEFDPVEQEVSTTTGSYEESNVQVMIKLTENLALQIFSYYNSYEIHARFLTITEAGVIFGNILTIAKSNVLIGESILEPVKIDDNRYLLIFGGAPSRNNDLSWKLYGNIININIVSKSITYGTVKSITQNASGRFYRESESSRLQTAYARKVSENTVFVITHVSTGNSSSNYDTLSYPLGVWVTINNMDLTLSPVQLLSNNGSGYTKRVKFISDTKFILVFRLVSSTYQGTIYASIGTLDPVNKKVSMSTPVLLSSNNGGYSIWLALSDEGNRFIVVANKYNGSSASTNMYWYVSVTINDDNTLTIENVEDLFKGNGNGIFPFSEKINGVYYLIVDYKYVCALKISSDFKSSFAQGEYFLASGDIKNDIIKTSFGIAGIWYKSSKTGLYLIVSTPSKLQGVSLNLAGTDTDSGLLMMNKKYLIASTDIDTTNNAMTLFKLSESGLKAVPLKGLADIVTTEIITPTVSGKAYLL